jgi:hypothetical protein
MQLPSHELVSFNPGESLAFEESVAIGANGTLEFEETFSRESDLLFPTQQLIVSRRPRITILAFSAIFSPSSPFSPSIAYIASEFPHSVAHSRSIDFLPSSPFSASDSFLPTRTFTQLVTPESGQSFSISFIESLSQSILVYSETSLTVLDITVISMSFYSRDYTAFLSMTRSVAVVHTLVQTVVAIPVYVRTVVSVRVNIVLAPTTQSTGMGTGMVLAVVIGAATVIAILLGIVVFLVRHKGESNAGSSSTFDDVHDTDTVHDIDTALDDDTAQPTTAEAAISVTNEAPVEHLSASLSSCSDGDGGFDGLFV